MELTWSLRSKKNLESIWNFISLDSEENANRVVRSIYLETNYLLEIFPEAGKAGRVNNTRELVTSYNKYVVIYKITNKNIIILSVRHGSRLWPKAF
jgi:toxin ParE1/3/4